MKADYANIMLPVYPEMKEIDPNTCKGGIPYYTFTCDEATQALRLYIKQREEDYGGIEESQPLFCSGYNQIHRADRIAVTYIIDELKMKEIAHVRSRYMPPAVVFMDGKLRHPFRIYSGKKGKLCAIVCEIPLRSDGLYPIASRLLDWAEEKGAKELVVLEGIAVRGMPKERKSFCVAEPEKRKECEEKGVKMISAGIIRGSSIAR